MSWKKLRPVSLWEMICAGIDALIQIVVQSILVALQDGELHALIGPEAVEGCEEFFRHGLFGADIRCSVDHFRIPLFDGQPFATMLWR